MSGDIECLTRLAREFAVEREWESFHTPKNLAEAMIIEAGEVLEHFRFMDDEESWEYLQDSENRREVGYELADVLYFLLRVADVTGIDLSASFHEKLEVSSHRYPVDQVRGRSDKYTEYE